MAYEYDELNKRQQEREQLRWQRQRARQRAQRQRILVLFAVLAVSLLVVGVLIFRGCQAEPGPSTALPPVSTTLPPATTLPQPTEPIEPETVITLVAGGDINVTDKVVASGENAGRYDYAANFMDILPILAGADATMVNFEGNLCGMPYGTASVSAPQELMQALSDAGVDYVQMANSYAVNNGLIGLRETLDGIAAANMQALGAFSSNAQFDQTQGFTLVDIGGIRVALVAFTKGVGSLGLPAGSEKCVNLLYKDYTTYYDEINTEGITAVLQAIEAQQPDITIALLHWGGEYNSIITAGQEQIRDLMLENGVDAIIGTHSHYVQKVEFDKSAGTVVAYSLGDLYGNAEKADTNYSILLRLEITRNNYTGKTKVTGCEAIPVYTLTPEKDGEAMRIVRIREAMTMYENEYIDKVTSKAYQNMKSALAKIQSKTGLEME